MPKKTSHSLLFWCVFFGGVVCPTTCDMKKLLDALVGANYSSHTRPVQHENETITVDLQMELYIIREMTAKLQILHANAWIQVSWLDLFLQWDPAAYGGIKVVTIPSELIWRPDIILFNDVDQERTAVEVFGHTMATVKFNGHIYWSMPVLFKSSCKFHPANYPFDVQVCPLTFGSWNHNSKEVNVTSSHKVKTYAGGRISENGEWELIGVKTRTVARAKRQRGGDFPFLIFDLTLMRKPLFYVFHLLVPAVMLMVISVLVFLVPTESKQKIGLASTVLLSMTVFMLFIMDHIPPTSEVISIFGRYFIGTMALMSLATYASVFVVHAHNLGSQGTRPSRLVRKVFIEFFGPWFGENVVDTSGLNSDSSREEVYETYAQTQYKEQELELYETDSSYIRPMMRRFDEEGVRSTAPRKSSIRYVPKKPESKLKMEDADMLGPTYMGHDEEDTLERESHLPTQPISVDPSIQHVELLMFEDIFQVLVDILDQLRLGRVHATPGLDVDEIIIAEWRAVANVADRICLIVFALLNTVFFFVVLFRRDDTTY